MTSHHQKRAVLVELAIILTLIALTRLPTVAQSADCGSGLPHRLSVGDSGYVIPEPPNLRLRDAPNGTQIGQVEVGTFFIVVGGPACADNISWYQIQSETDEVGWVAEGVDEYFVEPSLEMNDNEGALNTIVDPIDAFEIFNANTDCSTLPPTQFSLGNLVQFNAPDSVQIYYGHPNIVMFEFQSDMRQYYLPLDSFLLVEGPYCFNGNYYWRYAEPDVTTYHPYDAVTNDTYGGSYPFIIPYKVGNSWASEGTPSQPSFILVEEEVVAFPATIPSRITLVEPTAAPLIDVSHQISFSSGGGGGFDPDGWEVSCDLTAVEYFYFACLNLYPFVPGEEVEIDIFQPDGALFESRTVVAEVISAYARVGGSIRQEYSIGAARIFLPVDWGLPQGLWQVSAQSRSMQINRAYILHESAIAFQNEPHMVARCDGIQPLLVLGGFEPNQDVTLVLVTLDSLATVNDISTLEESYRWTYQTGANGELLIEMGFLPPAGYFVITDALGNWLSRFEDASILNSDGPTIPNPFSYTGLLIKASQWTCSRYDEYMFPTSLDYSDVITGGLGNATFQSFSLDGRASDLITLGLGALGTEQETLAFPRRSVAVSLRLESPTGVVLVPNELLEPSGISASNISLSQFILPEDGTYTITVSTEENRPGAGFMLFVDGQSQSEEQIYLRAGDLYTGVLEVGHIDLPFRGIAGETISIDVVSDEFDARVQLRDENGSVLLEDDDGGEGLNARTAAYTLPADGIYTVRVFTWLDKRGPFTLTVSGGS